MKDPSLDLAASAKLALMKRFGVLAIGLALAGCHPQAKLSGDPTKTVLGTSYVQARRLLLSQGYKTAQFGPSDILRRRSEICEDLEGQRCRTYPETWDCPSKGDCEFDLIRAADHQVLILTTQGDLPPSVWAARWATSAEIKVRAISNQ
jgi:hypothetical protein